MRLKALSDGVLVGEPKNLWFARDTDGDFQADEKELVSGEFGIRKANMESNANGLVWGMDNWIHTTETEFRVRRVDGEWLQEPTLLVGQFGLTMDDYGRMYRNNNSQPVYADYVESRYYARNPNMPRTAGVEEAIADDRQVWPSRTTRGANRGYQEGAMNEELVRRGLQDESPHIRASAVRLAEPFLRKGSTDLMNALAERVDDPSAAVRMQLAVTLGETIADRAAPVLLTLLSKHAAQPFMIEAVLSGLHGRELAFLEQVLQHEDWQERGDGYDRAIESLSAAIVKSDNPNDIDQMLAYAADENTSPWQRLALLEGVEDRFPSSRGVVLPLELPARPASLDRIVQVNDSLVREKAVAVVERLTWPGKPGSRDRFASLAPAAQERYESGREIYTAQCAVCHGQEGEGEEGVAVPLVGSSWVNEGHYNLIRILLQGKEGELGLMPPQRNLSDEEIAEVLTYVRNAWGNAAYPVTPGQAADLRVETAAREQPWTDAELRATVH